MVAAARAHLPRRAREEGLAHEAVPRAQQLPGGELEAAVLRRVRRSHQVLHEDGRRPVVRAEGRRAAHGRGREPRAAVGDEALLLLPACERRHEARHAGPDRRGHDGLGGHPVSRHRHRERRQLHPRHGARRGAAKAAGARCPREAGGSPEATRCRRGAAQDACARGPSGPGDQARAGGGAREGRARRRLRRAGGARIQGGRGAGKAGRVHPGAARGSTAVDRHGAGGVGPQGARHGSERRPARSRSRREAASRGGAALSRGTALSGAALSGAARGEQSVRGHVPERGST
mmetsp:Transcript_18053/g.68454  ORF Transcript_18053/g.68454 Transcript_18053/m.68454 type:complete len:290 (-) Transcript_18053:3369-4238(-)